MSTNDNLWRRRADFCTPEFWRSVGGTEQFNRISHVTRRVVIRVNAARTAHDSRRKIAIRRRHAMRRWPRESHVTTDIDRRPLLSQDPGHHGVLDSAFDHVTDVKSFDARWTWRAAVWIVPEPLHTLFLRSPRCHMGGCSHQGDKKMLRRSRQRHIPAKITRQRCVNQHGSYIAR